MATTMCRGCGQPLQAEESFCRVCGVKAEGAEVAAPTMETPSNGSSAPAPTVPVVPAGAAPVAAVAPMVTPTPTPPVMPAAPVAAVGMPQQPPAQPMYAAPVAPTPVAAMGAQVAAAAGPKTFHLKNKHLAAVAGVLAFILIAAAAAGAMTAPKPKMAGELVGSLPFGPEGGTQAFDNGAGKIKVPKGAVDGQKTIEVRRTIVRERVTAQSPTGAPLIFPPGALIAYTFGPIALVFNRPITITLTLPPGQGGIVFVTANGAIQFFPGTVAGRTITIRLNSLDLTRPGAIVTV